MAIENLSEDIILVELPAESPKAADELKAVNETISKRGDCDIIIDFCRVEIINSANISNLLILRSLLQNSGRQLILCNVAPMTKCIFVVAGLTEVFVFVEDRSAAVEAVQSAHSPTSAPSQ